MISEVDKLNHLHHVLLLIIKEVDMICKKYNITYYLTGGNAIGAIRHKGFIPWDDDLDIIMSHDDYRKFINICKKELDKDKWYVQEAWVDWPGCFSKIRLKNTYIEDIGEWKGIKNENRGIYIDIFEFIPVSSRTSIRILQYLSAKLLTAYSLIEKGYKTTSFTKKCALCSAYLLKISSFRRVCKYIVYKHRNKKTAYVGSFWGMSRYHNTFYPNEVFAHPIYVEYENLMLPLPNRYDYYLKKSFGNYMELPPESRRHPLHSLNINFGKF